MLFYFRSAVLIPTTSDRFYQTYKIIWIYITDITDTECICLRNLPRVNNKTLFFQLHIKRLEIKPFMWIKERSNVPHRVTKFRIRVYAYRLPIHRDFHNIVYSVRLRPLLP